MIHNCLSHKPRDLTSSTLSHCWHQLDMHANTKSGPGQLSATDELRRNDPKKLKKCIYLVLQLLVLTVRRVTQCLRLLISSAAAAQVNWVT